LFSRNGIAEGWSVLTALFSGIVRREIEMNRSRTRTTFTGARGYKDGTDLPLIVPSEEEKS